MRYRPTLQMNVSASITHLCHLLDVSLILSLGLHLLDLRLLLVGFLPVHHLLLSCPLHYARLNPQRLDLHLVKLLRGRGLVGHVDGQSDFDQRRRLRWSRTQVRAKAIDRVGGVPTETRSRCGVCVMNDEECFELGVEQPMNRESS